jgi:REP element-mobilizing transposase RayT
VWPRSQVGRDYSHRREWVRGRLEELAGIFAIEVLGYALMGNHMHLVIRTRPDVAAGWTDDQVALRWWTLFPQRRNPTGAPEQPTSEELNHIKNNATGLADKRRRLASVSWFMKCVSEPIAKRANREDEVTGHFWEARYKAQPLLDETAIAACMVYVDLNPIRAAVAQTPETSEFTSLHDRIVDRQSVAPAPSAAARDTHTEHGPKAGWLAPIALEPPCQQSRNRNTDRRLTNRGCLLMSLDQYLQLADWTGRQLRLDKAGRIPQISIPSSHGWTAASKHGWTLSKTFAGGFSLKPAVPNRCKPYLACGDIVEARCVVRDPVVTSESDKQQQSDFQISTFPRYINPTAAINAKPAPKLISQQ